MSIAKYLSIASLVLLPLSACDEETPDHEDPSDEGAGGASQDGGAHQNSDGSVLTGSDGGVINVPSGSDAGSKPGSSPGSDAGDVLPGDDNPGPSDGSAARFFLPTGEPTNTAAPRLAVDAHGNTHLVYPAFFKGDAFYTFCEGACGGDPSKLPVVRFPTDGTIYNAMIRLTADGKPRVLLSGSKNTYWAECDSNCTDQASWNLGIIETHNGDHEIDGNALALDAQGHPRFIMHTYRALYGIGQKDPFTYLAQCDGNCTAPASWSFDVVATNELWVGTSLQYDVNGKGHIATNIYSFEDGAGAPLGAYLACDGVCNAEKKWVGIGFYSPYESTSEAVDMHPAIALALTKDGRPRIAQIAKTPDGTMGGARAVVYWQCDQNCEGDNWKSGYSLTSDAVDEGIDIALDAQDRPRMVFTINYNIKEVYCDAADCAVQSDDAWKHIDVESGDDIPTDTIFLEYNCTVGAWFLHSPSIALTSDGQPRIGYQIRDVSGGTSIPDPSKPGCVAGTDMTLTRMSALPSYK